MTREDGRPIRSELGWSTADRIVVRGKDLPDEILGRMSLGEFAFFELTGRTPTPQEEVMFDAIVISLVEHGLTPSALADPADLRRRARVAAGRRSRRGSRGSAP